MLSIVNLLLDVLRQHVIWLYAGLGLIALLYIRAYGRAHGERVNTIFPVEREVAAHKEGRALSGLGTILGVAALLTAVRYYILPTLDPSRLAPPTPTVPMIISTATPTPEPTLNVTPTPATTARPTATRRPTPAVTDTPAQPTNTPPPPPPVCPNPGICIAYPRSGATISGIVNIAGTAQHPQFQFYKVEYGIGEDPSSWHSIGEVVRQPVSGGPLVALNTNALPNGVYWLKLTVVDITGNFPPPHAVRVVIQN